MPTFGKRTPLTRDHFRQFEKAFGADPHGKSRRVDEGEKGRFRCFTREEIKKRGDTLDISWTGRSELEESKNRKTPEILATEIHGRLQTALKELRALQKEGIHRS